MSNDIIKQLIELDHKACDLMEKAKKDSEIMKSQVSVDKDKLYDRYMSRANKRIGKVKLFSEEEEHEKSKEIQQHYEDARKKLQDNYISHKDQWIEILVKKCIDVKD